MITLSAVKPCGKTFSLECVVLNSTGLLSIEWCLSFHKTSTFKLFFLFCRSTLVRGIALLH